MQRGDGIASLLSMVFNMIKPALPKIASTIGLSGLSAGVSHGIKYRIIGFSDMKFFKLILPTIILYLNDSTKIFKIF